VSNTALEISPELENLPAGDSVELGLSHGSRSVRRSSVIDPSLGERAFVIEPVEYRHVHARGLQSRITVTADSSRAPGKAAAGNTRGWVRPGGSVAAFCDAGSNLLPGFPNRARISPQESKESRRNPRNH